MNTYLFNLTIGPVQGFIAQARKTQDLFAGSRMLSDLSRQGYHLVCKEFGTENVDLIFPRFGKAESDKNKGGSNPNRFSVFVKTNLAPSEIKVAGEKVKQELIDQFVSDGLEGMEFISGRLHERAERQLRDQLEIFWAAIPVTEENYAATFMELEGFINGSKNYRPYAQLMEAGRKCSVDGQRNVVVYRKTFAEADSNSVPKLFTSSDFQPYVEEVQKERPIPIWDLQAGEGLSAVTFAKRIYKRVAHDFPSTARICLLHDLDKIKEGSWDERIVKANGKLKHSDDHLFFEENINRSVFLKSGQFGTNEAAAAKAAADFLPQYKSILKEIQEAIPDSKVRFSTKYYGILVFDGDSMGDWLSGKNLQKGSNLRSFHQRLAELLHGFGEEAQSILSGVRGKTVYAGGDDFLGFLNLMSLMKTVGDLRTKFHTMVHEELVKPGQGYEVKSGKVFSFSAGIALGHYKQPLGMVLDEARDAEKLAKEGGRNALSISLIRHSGGTTRCVRGFGDLKSELGLQELHAMRTVIDSLSTKKCSNKFIHTIIRETQFWKADPGQKQFQTELKRLLYRAKDPKLGKEALDNTWGALKTLFESDRDRNQGDPQVALSNFLSTLRICDFIYRMTNDNEE